MPNILREVRVLRDEGKLHTRLITRVRILLGISAILLAVVIFNIVERGTNPLIAVALALIGLLLGVFIFSRMSPIQWNEEQEVVQTGRMDALGYGILALYVVFEITLRTTLAKYIPASETALLFAGIFGVLFGRVIGSVVEIHRVYIASHPE